MQAVLLVSPDHRRRTYSEFQLCLHYLLTGGILANKDVYPRLPEVDFTSVVDLCVRTPALPRVS
jgi:hypothetical protein